MRRTIIWSSISSVGFWPSSLSIHCSSERSMLPFSSLSFWKKIVFARASSSSLMDGRRLGVEVAGPLDLLAVVLLERAALEALGSARWRLSTDPRSRSAEEQRLRTPRVATRPATLVTAVAAAAAATQISTCRNESPRRLRGAVEASCDGRMALRRRIEGEAAVVRRGAKERLGVVSISDRHWPVVAGDGHSFVTITIRTRHAVRGDEVVETREVRRKDGRYGGPPRWKEFLHALMGALRGCSKLRQLKLDEELAS